MTSDPLSSSISFASHDHSVNNLDAQHIIQNIDTDDRSSSNYIVTSQKRNQLISFILLVAAAMLLVAAVLISIGFSNVGGQKNNMNDVEQRSTDAPIFSTYIPSSVPSYAPSTFEDAAITLFLEEYFRGVELTSARAPFLVQGTPQWNAKRWMSRAGSVSWNMTDKYTSSQRIIQKYVLAVIYFSMSKGGPMEVDWLMFPDECLSVYVNCNDDGFIRTLEISK